MVWVLFAVCSEVCQVPLPNAGFSVTSFLFLTSTNREFRL